MTVSACGAAALWQGTPRTARTVFYRQQWDLVASRGQLHAVQDRSTWQHTWSCLALLSKVDSSPWPATLA